MKNLLRHVKEEKARDKIYSHSIKNHFYININIYVSDHLPEYLCRKCCLLMTISMERKTTIKLTPFNENTPNLSRN